MIKVKKLIVLFILLFSFARIFTVGAAENDDMYSYAEKYSLIINGEEGKIGVGEFFGVAEKTENNDETDYEKYFDDLYSALPEDVKNELPKDADKIEANTFGFKFFFRKIKNTVDSLFVPLRKTLFSLLAMITLSAAVQIFAKGTRPGTGQALSSLCTAAICVFVIKEGIFSFERTRAFITLLSEVSTAILPTTVLLLGATGNISSAAIVGNGMNFLCLFLELLFSKIVYPLAGASAGFCAAGSIGNYDTAYSLSAFFRKISNFLTVFSMTFLVFVMAIQSTLASAADTLGMKTVKFAASSFIPLVGGAVSETLNAVGAGFTYVKNTCGAVSVVVIVLLLLPPLLALLGEKLVFSLCASLSGAVGLPKEERMFSEFSALADCLIALAVSASVVFIFILITVINCGVRIGGG